MENAEYEGKTVRGYAAVYNSDSEWMSGFYGQIATGAFDDVLDNDVRAYFNRRKFIVGTCVIGHTTNRHGQTWFVLRSQICQTQHMRMIW